MVLDDGNLWDVILAYTMFALWLIDHTTTQYMSVQLVFGHDSILNRCHNIDWEAGGKRKQVLINKGNAHKNKKLKTHMYQTGDKVQLRNEWETNFTPNAS